jgi:acyl-CoA oxidase
MMSSGNLEMNPDLAKERANCPFSKEELTNIIDGGPDKTAERRRVEKMYFEHPEVRIEI